MSDMISISVPALTVIVLQAVPINRQNCFVGTFMRMSASGKLKHTKFPQVPFVIQCGPEPTLFLHVFKLTAHQPVWRSALQLNMAEASH